MKKSNSKIRVGISIGDINGIGPEVIVKSLMDQRILDSFYPIIYGHTSIFKHLTEELQIGGFHFDSITDADQAHPQKINILNCLDENIETHFGISTQEAGAIAFKSLDTAVKDIASNKFDVLVTAPINKKNIQSKDFNFPGHTEYLADYANEDNPIMLMVHNCLRVGVVTGHIPVKDVANTISTELILKKLEALNNCLNTDFNIRKPKIAVLGLNPHSGDEGLIGIEEQTIIVPAIEKAKENGIICLGPYPADGFFSGHKYAQFDGVLAMYHDQGLTPFKTISQGDGVNFTGGLPIVRTSPDHGTGYDIAGLNQADETSFRNAIYVALDIYNNRFELKKLKANALVKSK